MHGHQVLIVAGSPGPRRAVHPTRSHDLPRRTGRPSTGPRGTGDRILRPGGMRLQNAETVLGVLRERGRKGLPCDELYRQLFNRELYLLAYGRIYANDGAMTPGASAETADGMSEDKIDGSSKLTGVGRGRRRPVGDCV
jgi:hypothetical protein